MKKAMLFLAVAASVLATGCSSPWVTNTKRSAVEQYLLAITIERLATHAGLDKYKGKKVYFDYSYLATQDDKVYVQGRLEMVMAAADCLIVPKKEMADIMIQPLCGVLATDHHTFLFGTPPLPIPVPYCDINIIIPEIPIFKLFTRKAYGRMAFNIFEARSRKTLATIPMINASSTYKNWIVLLVPFRTHNFDMKDTKETETSFEIM